MKRVVFKLKNRYTARHIHAAYKSTAKNTVRLAAVQTKKFLTFIRLHYYSPFFHRIGDLSPVRWFFFVLFSCAARSASFGGLSPFECFTRHCAEKNARRTHLLTADDVARIRAGGNARQLTYHYDAMGIARAGSLAPGRGKNIRLVMIDTGLAAYEFERDGRYHRHPDIRCRFSPAYGSPTYGSPTYGSLNAIAHKTRTPDRLIIDENTRVDVIREEIPCVHFTREDDATSLHGTHAYGLITGMSDAETIMIKAFDDNGHSDKKTLIRALEKAEELRPDILLIGLKLDDSLDPASPLTRTLESLLARFPCVVAAAGNDGRSMNPPRMSYPARFAAGHRNIFSIGSYAPRKTGPRTSHFSQYEPGIGPDFLMPGERVFSTAVPRMSGEPLYAFLSGTSTAATMFAGMLTLIQGEFKGVFSPERIRTVLIASARQMPEKSDRSRSLYGIPDLQTALFILHVLKKAGCRLDRSERIFKRYVNKVMRMLVHENPGADGPLAERIDAYAARLGCPQ